MTDDADPTGAPPLPVAPASPAPPLPGAPDGPDGPDDPDGPNTRPGRRRGRVLAVFGGVLLALALAGLFVRFPYAIISPGDAIPVSTGVRISGAPTYAHRGSVLFLTVEVSNERPNLYRYLGAELDSDASIVDEQVILQGHSRKADQKLDTALMNESQQLAKKVALEKLGYTVPVHGKGVIVARIIDGSPAALVLRVDDVITAVDGVPAMVKEELGPMVRARPPGTTLALTVERRGRTTTVPIVTTPAPSGEHRGQGYIGVAGLTQDERFDFPVDVTIDAGPVTGPSAGLAFTLTILDELTPGDLTGGKKVAVTGEIRSDGSVGEIGGIDQKAVTARRHGVALFIVPEREAKAARERAGRMRVVGVKDLDGALAALREAGGDPLPASPARSS